MGVHGPSIAFIGVHGTAMGLLAPPAMVCRECNHGIAMKGPMALTWDVPWLCHFGVMALPCVYQCATKTHDSAMKVHESP